MARPAPVEAAAGTRARGRRPGRAVRGARAGVRRYSDLVSETTLTQRLAALRADAPVEAPLSVWWLQELQ